MAWMYLAVTREEIPEAVRYHENNFAFLRHGCTGYMYI